MKAVLTILLIFTFFTLLAQAEIFEQWNEILDDYIGKSSKEGIIYNFVDYQDLSIDQRFSELLSDLAEFDPAGLKNRNEELAFWVNTYNIAAVKMILDNDIPSSIKDAGSLFKPVWKKDVITIAGDTYTLAQIEHDILRSFQEPLIHFAIVCASLSCPDLRNEAYLPETVIEQMEDNTRKFLQNESKGLKFAENKKVVYLSKIFAWFKEDFSEGMIEFIEQYSDKKLSDLRIKYLDYNWQLNSP